MHVNAIRVIHAPPSLPRECGKSGKPFLFSATATLFLVLSSRELERKAVSERVRDREGEGEREKLKNS